MSRTRIFMTVSAILAAAVVLGPARAHDVTCAPAGMAGGEWRRFSNDFFGSRNQTQELALTAERVSRLQPAWVFDANRWTGMQNNEVTGYPVVADGCLYVGSSTGVQDQTQQHPGWIFAINADDGDLVWRTQVDGGVFSTLEVADGRVYAFVSRVSAPFVVALDQATGEILWQRTVDRQRGSDAVSSPIVFDGLVWVGVSGTAAEGSEADRLGFQGNYVILDAQDGTILKKTYAIPPSDWAEGFAGAAIWSTIAIDPETKYGYAGTGNPFDYDSEHEHSNAVLKMDMDKTRSTFGEIVASFKGTVEEYEPEAAEAIDCEEVEEIDIFVAGFECARLDLDFGAQSNIFIDPDGRKLVGTGQKSGIYHVVDADTMELVWDQTLGVPSPFGGIVGTPAVDDRRIYGPHTIGGYLWSIDKGDGAINWITPLADGVHWGNPVTVANRVVYTVDLKGVLTALDAASGVPILQYPMQLVTGTDPAMTWGAVTVARRTVYASIGVGLTSVGFPSMPNGFVIAFRPEPFGL